MKNQYLITDKKYFMNSFHVNVTAKVNPFKKMEIEKPMFDLSNGGHIFYSEYPINHNIKAINQVTKQAMKMGLYEGINFDSAICENCGIMIRLIQYVRIVEVVRL